MTKEEFKEAKNSILTQVKAGLKEAPTRTELQQAAVNWALWFGMTEEETEELIFFLECNIVMVIKAIPFS